MKSKLLRIAGVLSQFEAHLLDNMGKPISLATIGAFSTMCTGIVRVLLEEE